MNGNIGRRIDSLEQQSPNFLAPGTGFVEENFPSTGVEDGLIQCITFIVHFISIISSTWDHQALDPRCWRPLV